MFGRGLLLIAVLIAAVAVPYFLVSDNAADRDPVARKWQSIVGRNLGQTPVPSISPIPGPSSGSYPHQRRSTPVPTSPYGLQSRATPSPYYGVQSSGAQTGSPASNAAISSTTAWMPGDGQAVNGVQNNRGSTATTGGGQSVAIEQLFNFHITPAWVVQNWPRVSSQLVDFEYSGLRVPIVTGTNVNDLAGSMTYYFDSGQQLQRMTFQGATGNPTQLIQLATSRIGMTSEPAGNGVCYVRRAEDQVTDLLRVRHANVTRQTRPNQRYQVLMELNRRDNGKSLSAANAAVLESEQKWMKFGN